MSVNPEALQAIFDRIEAGKRLNRRELQTLVEAARSQQVTIATGDRAVAIGGSADGAAIVTGDRNIIIAKTDAEAIRELIGKRPRTERLLLQAVKNEITSRLNQSLHQAVLIQLGMETQPEQVRRPWDSDVKIGDKPSEPLPRDWDISRVFDEMQGKLLILGNPGVGKTTVMLELAQKLCNRADQDANFPIPVLFNLSSWRDDRQPMHTWLIEELKTKYGVQKNIGQIWLKNCQLLPMLDGLDELQPTRQEACVDTLNHFLQDGEYLHLYLIVCSRQEEYATYKSVLQLNGAIRIEPLNVFQIKAYLADVCRIDLWHGVRSYPALRELVSIPLFLSIAVLADAELKVEQWQREVSNRSRLQYLLNAYIRQMLLRKIKSWDFGSAKVPDQKQTKQWLVFLSKQLQKDSQTEFLIEKMQPSWLLNQQQQWFYELLTSLSLCLIIILSIGLVGGVEGLLLGCAIALTFLIVFGSPGGIISNRHREIEVVETLNWSWQRAGQGIINGLHTSLITSSTIWLYYKLSQPVKDTLMILYQISFWVFLIFVIGSGISRFSGLYKKLKLWNRIKWFQQVIVRKILIGLDIILLFAIFLSLTNRINSNLKEELTILVMSGLFLGLVLGFLGGLTYSELEIKIKPNQGIWRTIVNTFTIPLVFGSLVFGYILVIRLPMFNANSMSSISSELNYSLDLIKIGFSIGASIRTGVILWILLGMIVWIVGGLTGRLRKNGLNSLLFCVQHFSLRLLLYLNGYSPWNYARFLDYCTNRLLLQRVGGRYRFIHRLLQEHFAAMPLERK